MTDSIRHKTNYQVVAETVASLRCPACRGTGLNSSGHTCTKCYGTGWKDACEARKLVKR